MSKKELVDYLQAHTIFSALEPRHVKVLAQQAKEKKFAAGELLFTQEDSAAQFYVVREGAISVEVPSVYGPPLQVQGLGANEVLGWSWLIPPYKWAFQAKAEQDTTVLEFDGKALLQRCENNSVFGYALLKLFAGLMSERLQAARLKMMETWAPAGWA